MCGVAGFISKEPMNLNHMRPILSEIGIRGWHSTGVSWLENGEIKTKIESVPHMDFEIPNVETTSAIFHTRYSTSNLEYPQPVFNEDKSVAHNGVITQMEFNHWKSIFGYGGTYRCDSVLLLEPNKHPLIEFPDSSMAVVELKKDGLSFYRNGQRPLYVAGNDDYVVVASTKAAVPQGTMLKPGYSYSCSASFIKKAEHVNSPEEWQT